VRTRSILRGWIEAALTAIGAGCAAVVLQPADVKWSRQAIAFLAAALPVLAVHGRATPKPAVGP